MAYLHKCDAEGEEIPCQCCLKIAPLSNEFGPDLCKECTPSWFEVDVVFGNDMQTYRVPGATAYEAWHHAYRLAIDDGMEGVTEIRPWQKDDAVGWKPRAKCRLKDDGFYSRRAA